MAKFQKVGFKFIASLDSRRSDMGMYEAWRRKDDFYAEDVSQSVQCQVFLVRDKVTV